MTKEEMKLKAHYELRNHIGAMALKKNKTTNAYYRSLYESIKRLKEVFQ